MKLILFAICSVAFAEPVLADPQCFDVGKGEPHVLNGLLSARVFAGPPNYEDVTKGDTPEPGYVLTLDHKICLTGDDDFADPTFQFDEVQLVPMETTRDAMRTLSDHEVWVELKDPFPAHTGHHHRPLVAWVRSISAGANPTRD